MPYRTAPTRLVGACLTHREVLALSKKTKIGIIVSVICAVPATLAYILTTEIRQLQQGHITVIDAA